MKHHAKKRLPIPGQRLIRSLLAVLLCFAIYDLRGHQGLPFYSVIAALQCVQQYTRSMKAVARRRVIGTLIGAAGGLSVVLLELWIARRNPADSMVHYLIIGLATILVMYFTVVLKIADMAYFSAVVFLSIAINHIGDLNPFLYVFHRSLDTIIGVLVAELVNRIHFPRLRHTDTLFVSRIHDTLFETGEALSDYARIELNRLIDDGCLFTISTIQTPASVRELLPGVRLKLPIIAMDGTVLYDTEKREYLETVAMDPQKASKLCAFLDAEEIPFFLNTIEHNLLTIRYGAMSNDAIRRMYEQKLASPYRNFVPRSKDDHARILYILLFDREEKINEALRRLREQPWFGGVRFTYDHSQSHDGYLCVKMLPSDATQEKMQAALMTRLGVKSSVSFGPDPVGYDVYVDDSERDQMVKELKKRFEPISIKGWAHVFQFRDADSE